MKRERLVEVARSFIGIPFHHQGKSKAGVDCFGLFVLVAGECGIELPNERRYWEHRFGAPALDGHLLDEFKKHCVELNTAEDGDLLVMWNEGRRSDVAEHVAMKTDQGIIHCHSLCGVVCEMPFEPPWSDRVLGIFEFPGVEN
jgi:cell wall-associated NlpC family hydrolase